jgi:sulfate adenylyltransferase subunit 1 (EFTu-like GTPase family)
MKLVLIGGVDHGKSTLLARLADESRSSIWATENPDELTGQMEWTGDEVPFVDSLAEEKKGLYTLDTTQVLINVNDRYLTLIDVPGHDLLIRNMVTGASQAEAALLVVDALQGICPMTLRHLEVLRLLKITPGIACITKMETVDYDTTKFELLATSISETLLRFNLPAVATIPVSAYTLENIRRRTEKMAWFRGPTLWEALSDLTTEISAKSKGVRFMIQDHYRLGDRSLYVGRVASGEIGVSQELVLYPDGQLCSVRSIEKFGEPQLERAVEGDCIGLTLATEGTPRVGQLLSPVDDVPLVGSSLAVTLMNLGPEPIETGAELQFQCASLEAICHVSAIEPTELTSESIAQGLLRFSEIGKAVLSFDQSLAVESFQNVPSLGRFVLAKTDKTVAGGVIQGCAK